MKKFYQGFALSAAVILISSQSFAVITIRTLNCGSAKSANGLPLLGMSYKVQIKGGFDTHTVNPNGTIGAPLTTTFQLVSTVVSPSAQPVIEQLTLVSRDNGNYNLIGNGVTVVVNGNASQAAVLFTSNNATASCD